MSLKLSIRYQKNKTYELIDMLQKTDRPIGLWGAGVYARHMSESLKTCGIEVSFLTVDDQYLKSSDNSQTEVPIISIEECNMAYRKPYIIVAFEYPIEKEFKILQSAARKFRNDADILVFDHPYFYNDDFLELDYRYYITHAALFEYTYNMLEDDLSRRIMSEAINAWISGDSHGLIQWRTDDEHEYELLLIKENIDTKGCIVDCGAYDGNTALQLSAFMEHKYPIYAMELEERNFDLLSRNTAKDETIIPVKMGVGNFDGRVPISGDAQGVKIVSQGEITQENGHYAEITKIDTFFKDKDVAAVLMDVEGSELDALMGMRETILRNRPVLGVRVYHRKDDLITIPRYLRSFFDEGNKYKLYLRENLVTAGRGPYEVTLYAV